MAAKKNASQKTNKTKTSKETKPGKQTQAAKAASKPKEKKKASAIVICLIAVLALAVVLGGCWFFLMGPGTSLFTFKETTVAGVALDGMTKDEAAAALADVADIYSSETMVVEVLGETIELSPADTGCQLDVEALVDAAYSDGPTVTFDVTPYLNLDTAVIQGAVDELAQRVRMEYVETSYRLEGESPEAGQTLYITMGCPERTLKTEELYNAILAAYAEGTFHVTGECDITEPEAVDFESVFQQYYMPPVDATMDPTTFDITEGTAGYGFNTEEAETLLANVQYGETIELTIQKIEPAVTAATLWDSLFQDVLSTCSTPYTSNEYRNNNLRLACAAIDGTILYPGDVFSYNGALGERTAEKGYLPGASYEGGKVVYTYGGGICQVSSTMYYCSLIADLEIVERECHMYPADYIDYGMDATVNWGTIDYKFRNNTNYPIRINADAENGYVTVTFSGTDDKDYYVEMEYEIVAVYDYKTVYKEYAPDNEEGYYDGQTITWPVVGYGVDTYRCKYSKETGELISREYEAYSDYDHRDMEICKIVYPEETQAPSSGDEYTGSGGVSPDSGG